MTGLLALLREARGWLNHISAVNDPNRDILPKIDAAIAELEAAPERKSITQSALDKYEPCLSVGRCRWNESQSAPQGEPSKLIGYTTAYDLEYPFSYASLGPQTADRCIPVYAYAAPDARAEMSRMRRDIDVAQDNTLRAQHMFDEQKARAEAAEKERDALRAQLEAKRLDHSVKVMPVWPHDKMLQAVHDGPMGGLGETMDSKYRAFLCEVYACFLDNAPERPQVPIPEAKPDVVRDAPETAWMIECREHFTGWWTGALSGKMVDCRFFSKDPNVCVRFARKEDAERVILSSGHSCQIATEHQWIDAALQSAEQPRESRREEKP